MAGKTKAQKDPLPRLLACPRCVKARLDAVKDGLRCRRCETAFPELDGIPWLFANPAVAWGAWRDRLDFALKTLRREADSLSASLEREGLHRDTADRLETLRRAKREQADALETLMAPLELGGLEANHTTHLALRTRLPSDQGLNTYYPNVHRDWCWGDEENSASASLVRESLGEPRESVLVLGSGASRLAYDLHQDGESKVSVAMDFNPMLLLLAKKMIAGDRLELYEFPIAPKRAADCAVLQTLAAPRAARRGLRLVAGDALRAPFAAGSFDSVVTPWFVDVIPEDFATLCVRINHLLKPGGRWVNFGSLAFSNQDAALNYSLEEAVARIAAAGFEEPALREATLPYMASPHSRHSRRETVVTTSAVKVAEASAPPRFQALPEFLVGGDTPVPLLQSFQVQAMTTRIHAFMMTLIDGQRSILDMAKLMEEHKLMPRDQAEASVRSFLIKMFDESQRQTGI